MVTDEFVKQLFQSCQNSLDQYWQDDTLAPCQYIRGVTSLLWKNAYPANCRRHLLVFKKYNIIPKYCFDCYKVVIKPRNVVELFKLMVIFDELQLPSDNTRKCMVELRPQVSGAYKGLIISQNLDEAKDILDLTQSVISEEISTKIPVSLKRGCSEYPIAYPEYATFNKAGYPVMKYREEWQEYEDRADNEKLAAHLKPIIAETYNHPELTHRDARVMLSWLKYAATIGDLSYLKITEKPISKLSKIKPRPPFQAVEDE